MSCPSCGSTNHVCCTREASVVAIDEQVSKGKPVASAAIEVVAEEHARRELWLSRLLAVAEDLGSTMQSIEQLCVEWPEGLYQVDLEQLHRLASSLSSESRALKAIHHLATRGTI